MASSKVLNVPEELRHKTVIRGTANGKTFRLEGEGVGRPYDGKLASVLKSNAFRRARCPLPVLVTSSLGCILVTSNAKSFISLFVAQERRNYVIKRYRKNNESAR